MGNYPSGCTTSTTNARKINHNLENRNQAFATIIEGIKTVIQQVRYEEKYPVQEYGLAFDYYTSMDVQTQEELTALERITRQRAEQWLVAIQSTGRTLQEVDPKQPWDDGLFLWKKWRFTLHQLYGYVHIRNPKSIFAGRFIYNPIYLRVTTSHAVLLDHFMHMGKLPYKTLQWTLVKELDLANSRTQIYEQTGKLPISSSNASTYTSASLKYRIYDEYKNHGVDVSFFSQTQRSPAKIHLTSDITLDGTFYRAHELFSVRKILSILRGEISYKQVACLIEEACTP